MGRLEGWSTAASVCMAHVGLVRFSESRSEVLAAAARSPSGMTMIETINPFAQLARSDGTAEFRVMLTGYVAGGR